MDELISRRDTISAMEGTDWYHIKGGRLVHGVNSKDDEPLYKAKDVYTVLNTMPSAQPEVLACGEGELIAQPEIIRCKDCKHWKDSDGVYRRGIGAESKCPVNIRAVYEGNFYCADAERKDG